jgi:ketopantoate hydroxymethyltransferase
MIYLHRTQTARGEVTITLDQATRVVSYCKAGVVQTQVDGKGRNLSPFVAKAVETLTRESVRRVLVLGHAGAPPQACSISGGWTSCPWTAMPAPKAWGGCSSGRRQTCR